MQEERDKFFEELAKDRARNEEDFEVQLAKVRAASPVKTIRKIAPIDSETEGTLTIDVYQTPSEIVVESAIAGIDPKNLDITATGDSVVIKGERHREQEADGENYFYQECYWGKFSRSVILPQEVDPEAATVSFKNGVLKIRLPKLVKQRTRKLSVKTE